MRPIQCLIGAHRDSLEPSGHPNAPWESKYKPGHDR
jgi:hypothetical protein